MGSILFWMIFLQVSIFVIGLLLLFLWLVMEPREKSGNFPKRVKRRKNAKLASILDATAY